MSDRVIELAKAMGRDDVEKQIAFHCAPVLMGCKCSNIFITTRKHIAYTRRLFEGSPVACKLLYTDEKKAIFFIYRPVMMHMLLQDSTIGEFLGAWGYEESLEKALSRLSSAYGAYLRGKGEFPHEIGLFLGYPVEDVIGFITNNGKDCLYSGYWKVYENVAEKKALFQTFDHARELVMRLVSHGVCLRWITMAYGPAYTFDVA